MSERRVFLDYLLDMREALSDIQTFTAGMSQEDFLRDKKTRNAVLRSLEVLGEAAGKIPRPLREQNPGLPWPEMIGLRNRLIHEYFGVDYDIVWQTIRVDLPLLDAPLDAMIESCR